MNHIVVGQVVASNTNYESCEEGYFEDYDYVVCKRINCVDDCIVTFFAISIVKLITNESSI